MPPPLTPGVSYGGAAGTGSRRRSRAGLSSVGDGDLPHPQLCLLRRGHKPLPRRHRWRRDALRRRLRRGGERRLAHGDRGMLGGHGGAGRVDLAGEEARTGKPASGRE